MVGLNVRRRKPDRGGDAVAEAERVHEADLVQLYEELLCVARVESNAIDTGDEVALAECVARRDELFGRIKAAGMSSLFVPQSEPGADCEDEGQVERGVREQVRQQVDQQVDRQCDRQADKQPALQRLQQLINDILEVDRENARKLAQRMDQLQAESARLRDGRKGRKGYEEPVAFEPRFIDRRT